MKVLKLIYLFSLLLFFTSCEDDPITKISEDKNYGCTDRFSFNYNSSADTDDGSCKSMAGCLGYVGNMTNSGSLGTSLGDPGYDFKMEGEVAIQRSFWQGVPTEFWILYELSADQRNAWADPAGRILFGYHFFWSIIGEYGELPIAGVIAHEFSHRAQQHFGFNYSKRFYQELEADAFSGFYMAMVKQWSWSTIETYFKHVYDSGDTNFNDPTHHGTNLERFNSAYLGVNVAISSMQSGTQYSYSELHDIFQNEIVNNIAPRSDKAISFDEVVYPDNLSEEYIKSLFPRPE